MDQITKQLDEKIEEISGKRKREYDDWKKRVKKEEFNMDAKYSVPLVNLLRY